MFSESLFGSILFKDRRLWGRLAAVVEGSEGGMRSRLCSNAVKKGSNSDEVLQYVEEVGEGGLA